MAKTRRAPRTDDAQATDDAAADERVLARETRNLPVKLTDDELLARSSLIAQRMGERRRLLAQLQEVKDDYKARLSKLETEIEELGGVLERKTEIREVECEVVIAWEESRVETRRVDSGDVVDSRALNPEERQRELFRRNKKKEADKAKADTATPAAGG